MLYTPLYRRDYGYPSGITSRPEQVVKLLATSGVVIVRAPYLRELFSVSKDFRYGEELYALKNFFKEEQ